MPKMAVMLTVVEIASVGPLGKFGIVDFDYRIGWYGLGLRNVGVSIG